jgi:vitamin B12 transporter
MLWGDRVTFGSTVFENDITQMIDFDFATFRYMNVARARMRGMESVVTYRPLPDTQLSATHTWLVAEDEVTTYDLVRRPKHAFTAAVDHGFAEGKAYIGASLRAMGDRPDTDASFSRAVNPFFYTVGVNGSYEVSENVELYGRLENLFDRDYEEVLTFGSPGFSIYVGARTSF